MLKRGDRYLYCAGDASLLFTENETNKERNFGTANAGPYVKDAIDDYVVHGRQETVNPEHKRTKAAAHYQVKVGAGETATIRLRFSDLAPAAQVDPFRGFTEAMQTRQREADEFYRALTPEQVSGDEALVMRQALAGMLWSLPRTTAFRKVADIFHKHSPGRCQLPIQRSVDSPVRFRMWACVGPYNESIPAIVHFADSGCDQATCKPGSYPPLDTPPVPVGQLRKSVAETSNPPGVGPSCSLTPMAESPESRTDAAGVQVVIIVRRSETQFCPRGDTKTHQGLRPVSNVLPLVVGCEESGLDLKTARRDDNARVGNCRAIRHDRSRSVGACRLILAMYRRQSRQNKSQHRGGDTNEHWPSDSLP
jgi:hypothetical protein